MELNKLLIHCLLPLGLPKDELGHVAKIVAQGMEQRIEELSAMVENAQQHCDSFEERYQVDFAAFRVKYLQDPDHLQEDFITWGFWEKIKGNRTALLAKYDELINSPGDC